MWEFNLAHAARKPAAGSTPSRFVNFTSPNDLLAALVEQRIPDPYAQCPELDDWDLHAISASSGG